MSKAKRDGRGWTRTEAVGVIERARDVRLREAAGSYGTASDEPADGSLRRLNRLKEILEKPLGVPDLVREWRLSQLAMLFPGKVFPEPKRIDLAAIIR